MEQAENCVSCGKGLLKLGSSSFKCPECKKLIGRCNKCREQGQKYTCPKCGFTGP
ncbi:MAG: zinc finger domain-containing protein [Candidatus Thermoplasmatota archaeon]